MKECLHIIVKGKVQGVYFRAYTQKQAVKHNLNGFVRNLPNGDVEIVAEGERADLHALVTWCYKGPLLARVKQVVANPHQGGEVFEGFEIR